jgi:hypothetical protein
MGRPAEGHPETGCLNPKMDVYLEQFDSGAVS